jgi:hypothetical protein
MFSCCYIIMGMYTFNHLDIDIICMNQLSVSMLTKLCPICGLNMGINWFFIDEEGNWSEMCKFCQPRKPC